MRRYPDWQERLTAYLASVAHRPLEPGVHDCALFAANAVLAMTGTDLAAAWRGRYRTLRGGQRVLRAAGYADHIALAASHFAEMPAAYARPGDLAVVDGPHGPALTVVQGRGVYVLTPSGLGTLSLLTAKRAFKVG